MPFGSAARPVLRCEPLVDVVRGEVAAEVAELCPAEFDAVTRRRKVLFSSATVTAWVATRSPAISPQPAPTLSHIRHWWPYCIGCVPVHAPVLALSVCPS